MAKPRITVLLPDPQVPLDRLETWLVEEGLVLNRVELWRTEVPPLTHIGDGLMIMGGRQDINSYPWLGNVQDLMADAIDVELPVLAVCLGHQILADAFGGRVVSPHPDGGELGAYHVDWLPAASTDPLLGAATRAGTVVPMAHNDVVTDLPPGAKELARTKKYANAAFRLGSAVGVQFHPEASPELMGRWIRLRGGDPTAVVTEMKAVDQEVTQVGRALGRAFAEQVRRPR